ncbi:hypothetical protein MFIFM68171_07254 [Madurella fahalii]|uniref:Uncharacterized protein n=1 Tax=Madurella fahalii TaxID=1157608 RepID=A0ABQ0GH20_9PEZI
MKLFLFLTFSYLPTAVWAGGYQGCLERILLFQAYQIDQLNDEPDRTIGYKCTKWNDESKSCSGVWQACRPKRNGATQCNYDELIVHLGKTNVAKGWSVLDDKGNLDVKETALATYRRYAERPKAPSAPLIPNFPPFVAMKEAYEWNDFIIRLNKKVNDTYKSKRDDRNKHLWEAFDSTGELIRVAHAGDHGPYLYNAAHEILGEFMVVHKQKLGKNPLTDADWETVDWRETAVQAKARGVPEVDKKIKGFLAKFYHGTTTEYERARKHYQVIKSYKRMAASTIKCRKK